MIFFIISLKFLTYQYNIQTGAGVCYVHIYRTDNKVPSLVICILSKGSFRKRKFIKMIKSKLT